MVSGQFQHCTTIRDCKIYLICKIGETEQCLDNQCKCGPTPQIKGQPCRKTHDCDATICKDFINVCVDGFCTCTPP